MAKTTRKRRTNGSGSLRLYRSYNFMDKDPVIDELRTIHQREGLSYSQIGWLSGISSNTIHNWFEGKTRRPQNASIEAYARALGYRRKFEKTREVNYDREIAKAKEERAEAK